MATRPRPVYVETTGDDVSGQGTSRRPFATPQRAVDFLVTRAWATVLTADQYINIGEGVYYDAAFEVPAAANGGNGFDVVYRTTGEPGDTIISGGSPVSGWVLHSGSTYKIAVDAPVTALYENGQRAIMARAPVLNPGVDYPCAFAPYFTSTGIAGNKTAFTYDGADFDPDDWVSTLASIRFFFWSVVFSPQTAWFTDWHGAPTIDTGTQTFTLDNDGLKFWSAIIDTGARYYVAGDLSMLTEAGTFVNNFESGQWWLYYIARDGIAPEQTIVLPTAKSVVSVIGDDDDTRVSNVRFDGLAVTEGAWDNWYRYGTDGSGPDPYDYFNTIAEFRQGGFYLENAENVTIDSCHVSNTGFNGVFLQGACTGVTVSNTWIEHTGGAGIAFNGLAPGAGDLSTANTVYNVKINNFGELDGSATGIRLSQSSLNAVSHFDISQGPNRAVWVHGGFDVPGADNYAYGNQVSYGVIDGVCQDSGDRGALGCSFTSADSVPAPNPDNVFNQIRITNVYAHPSMLDHPPNGVYCDNHSSGTLTNIDASDTQGALFRINDSEEGNFTLTNTSFLIDGSANPGFDPDAMDPTIGIVAATWPF